MATYLITQATGHQSRAIIEYLLAAGAKVHALVRDPTKIQDALREPGITIFKGESVHFDQVYEAAKGCQAVYVNTFPIPDLEAQQAQTIVDASRKAGIQHAVVSTTFSTGNRAEWDNDFTKQVQLHAYYASKSKVEDVVRGAGFQTYTVLRPGLIHVDYVYAPSVEYNWPGFIQTGELVHAFHEHTRFPQTDADDIGRYGAAALQDPSRYGGHEIELFGDYLTIAEVREVLASVSGREVRQRKRSPEEREAAKDHFLQKFQLWANEKDFGPVVEASRRSQEYFGIPMNTLKTALRRDRDLLLECVPVV